MSVQIPCFAHVVAEVSTIRSGLTELLARLAQLETRLSTAGDISTDRRIATEGQSELELEPEIELKDALPLDLTAPTDLVIVVSMDATTKTLCEDAVRQSDACTRIAPDCTSAIVAALTDAMGPAAGLAPDAGLAETNSLLVATEIEATPAVGMLDEAEISAIVATDLSSCASTVSHCRVAAAGESDGDGQRGSAVMSSQANAALQRPDDDPVAVTPDMRMPEAPAPLPALVAAQLADKAACGNPASLVDVKAGAPDCEAQEQPPVAASPAFAVASPSTSLVVLPCAGAATRSPSRKVGRRIVAAIAASLIICVAAGAGFRLVDDRWLDTLHLAVHETLRLLPELWQRAAAHEAADTQVILIVSQD